MAGAARWVVGCRRRRSVVMIASVCHQHAPHVALGKAGGRFDTTFKCWHPREARGVSLRCSSSLGDPREPGFGRDQSTSKVIPASAFFDSAESSDICANILSPKSNRRRAIELCCFCRWSNENTHTHTHTHTHTRQSQVPAISLLEWHPFTISSSPDDRETTHHVKDMGPTTFTGRLR